MIPHSPFIYVFLGFFITGLASGWWLFEFNIHLKLNDSPPLDYDESAIPYYRGFYASQPGEGPRDETCETCDNMVFVKNCNGKLFPKCKLVKKYWTHGEVTDIQSATPSCIKWIKIISLGGNQEVEL